MRCYVYKGHKKSDHYLYLGSELDDSNQGDFVPEAVLNHLGNLSLVLDFELTVDQQLAQADPAQVLADIESQGFYLQMPKKDMFAEEERYFN